MILQILPILGYYGSTDIEVTNCTKLVTGYRLINQTGNYLTTVV